MKEREREGREREGRKVKVEYTIALSAYLKILAASPPEVGSM